MFECARSDTCSLRAQIFWRDFKLWQISKSDLTTTNLKGNHRVASSLAQQVFLAPKIYRPITPFSQWWSQQKNEAKDLQKFGTKEPRETSTKEQKRSNKTTAHLGQAFFQSVQKKQCNAFELGNFFSVFFHWSASQYLGTWTNNKFDYHAKTKYILNKWWRATTAWSSS